MDELSQGFRIGDRLVGWGVTLGEIANLSGLHILDRSSERAPCLACRSAYGLPTLCATLDGPAGDRPVLAVSYELVPPRAGAAALIGALAKRFGRPATSGRQAPPPHADPSGAVVEWAQWQFGEVAAGVSIYGALRAVHGGNSAGILWLRWANEAAARPYLRSWMRQSVELERAAAGLSAIQTFDLAIPQLPSFFEKGDDGNRKRFAGLSLYRPSLCITPPQVARKLPKNSIAIWSAGTLWCVSTRWDSLPLGRDRPIAARHIDLMPARGSGAVYLEVGEWSARDAYPSTEMGRIADVLRRAPGVTVSHTSDYDY
jgi:hypothetical protein